MQKITVVSLGPGPREHLTLGSLERLKRAKRLILRTGEVDCAAFLREQSIKFETLDSLHEECEDFDEFIEQAVEKIAKSATRAQVVYGVLDALSDETVAALRTAYPEQVSLTGGAGLAQPLLQAAGAQLPVRVVSATSLTVPDTQDNLLVVEMNTRMLAGECKLALASWYGDDMEVLFFPPAEKENRAFLRMPLCEIDRQPKYDHTAAVYLPSLPLKARQRYDLWDLNRVMNVLRGEGGCPWDLAQTHRTLSRYLIEEAYETSEAVEREDWEHVADELGDVLLQVIFQANIGAQYGTFELSDVTTDICKKMIERHPHIFAGGHADTPEEVFLSWEQMKQKQRGNATAAARLRDVSAGLPGLLRAEKMFRKMEAQGMAPADLLEDGPARRILEAVQALRQAGLSAEEEVQIALLRLIERVDALEKSGEIRQKMPEELDN
ncbi:MAG: MazG family protein [Clostridia bacterium]|nr:MazG family protein [Clostridia bacterium]